MNVKMVHVLAGGPAVIPTDVEAPRPQGLFQQSHHALHPEEQRTHVPILEEVQALGMHLGDDHRVAPRGGVDIQEGQDALVPIHRVGVHLARHDLAENAVRHGRLSFPCYRGFESRPRTTGRQRSLSLSVAAC